MPRPRVRLPALCALVATLLAAAPALADRVLLLPARGTPDDPAASNALEVELAQALAALGHSAVPAPEAKAALAAVQDGVADAADEYRAVAAATKADWVLGGSIEPAVITARVELVAYLASMGRVESVAREVQRAQSGPQVQEMVAVLLRPEGIGAGE